MNNSAICSYMNLGSCFINPIASVTAYDFLETGMSEILRLPLCNPTWQIDFPRICLSPWPGRIAMEIVCVIIETIDIINIWWYMMTWITFNYIYDSAADDNCINMSLAFNNFLNVVILNWRSKSVPHRPTSALPIHNISRFGMKRYVGCQLNVRQQIVIAADNISTTILSEPCLLSSVCYVM